MKATTLIVLGGLMFAGTAIAADPQQATTADSSMKVGIDAKTGKLRRPTAAESAQLDAMTKNQMAVTAKAKGKTAAKAGPVTFIAVNGMAVSELDDTHMSEVQATIGADGLVSEAVVTGPAGEGFDEAAVAALKKFVFTPAEVDFKPAPVQVEYVYHFVLKEPEDAGVPLEVDAGVPMAKLIGQLYQRGSRGFVAGAIVRCDNAPEHEAYSDDEGKFALELPLARSSA